MHAGRPELERLENLPRGLLDPWEKEPERLALVDDEGEVSFGNLIEATRGAGRALHREGVRPGDRVMLVLFDGRAFVEAFWGALRIGGVFCAANPRSDAEALAKLIFYSRPAVIVADAEVEAKVQAALRRVDCPSRVLVVGRDWAERCAQGSGAPDVETAGTDPAGWLFTSGTSRGAPRAAVHSHRDFAFATARYALGVLGLQEDDVCLSVPRLHFGYGTGTSLIFPAAVGATAVLFAEKPTAARLLKAAQAHRATVLANVPTVMREIINDASAADALASLRLCISAGEALSPQLAERWAAVLPKAPVLDGLGAAETFHIFVSQRLGEEDRGTLGRLVDGYEAKVVDERGAPVAQGQVGRLWLRGGSIASEYWQAPALSAETFSGGWYRSADLVSQRPDGRFVYAGRAGDTIKVKGQFVAPRELERCLGEHPGVEECAVVSGKDSDGLGCIAAYIVGDVSEDELRTHCAGRLGKHKVPGRFYFPKSLPRSDRGKVLRRLLRG